MGAQKSFACRNSRPSPMTLSVTHPCSLPLSWGPCMGTLPPWQNFAHLLCPFLPSAARCSHSHLCPKLSRVGIEGKESPDLESIRTPQEPLKTIPRAQWSYEQIQQRKKKTWHGLGRPRFPAMCCLKPSGCELVLQRCESVLGPSAT